MFSCSRMKNKNQPTEKGTFFSYHLFNSFESAITAKPLIYKTCVNKGLYSFDQEKEVATLFKTSFNLKSKWKLPISQLQICISSPNQIRSICLRKSTGICMLGRTWNSRTVNYKDLKPIPGGLFCASTFGSLHIGICNCKRTWWRRSPKTPKKLRRRNIDMCFYCLTPTIFSPLPSQKIFKTHRYYKKKKIILKVCKFYL